jgi:hypothetical protein
VTAITATCERTWYSRFRAQKNRRKEAVSTQPKQKALMSFSASNFHIAGEGACGPQAISKQKAPLIAAPLKFSDQC